MTSAARLRARDLRAAARLATDATTGVTDLVEAVHERIARWPGLPAPAQAGRTRGLTGVVYRTIRGITRGVGGGLDAALGLLGPVSDDVPPSPQRDAWMAALNGVLGDQLASTGNPWATPMTLRSVVMDRPAAHDGGNGRAAEQGGGVLVLAHGLCMNDAQWLRRGHHHGRLLAQALGLTPLALRYNSGQHIATNGWCLAQLLEQRLADGPHPAARIVLLGHSMGGLVLRSALHHGQAARHRWPGRVSDVLFLGTPHLGAPLERVGHGVGLVWAAIPYAAPFARLARLRSAGITDLRQGALLASDGAGRDRFARHLPLPQPVPLPTSVRAWAIAGSLDPGEPRLKSRWLGDGLVPLESALGRHADPARDLAIPAQRQWIAHGVNHLDLLSDRGVAQTLLRWLTAEDPPR